WLCLAAAFTIIRRLINRARTHYRWPTRPTTRRLR
ncbi:MAG: IS5/IS1182 family transposase, partial [Pseudonocardiaceae bacterium]